MTPKCAFLYIASFFNNIYRYPIFHNFKSLASIYKTKAGIFLVLYIQTRNMSTSEKSRNIFFALDVSHISLEVYYFTPYMTSSCKLV